MNDENKSSQKVVKKRISVTLTRVYVDALNQLVEGRLFVNRAEAIKAALRRLFSHYGMMPFVAEGTASREGLELSEEALVERIDVLKDSEASIRAERQELEKKVRDMKQERLLSGGAEG